MKLLGYLRFLITHQTRKRRKKKLIEITFRKEDRHFYVRMKLLIKLVFMFRINKKHMKIKKKINDDKDMNKKPKQIANYK